VGGVRSRQRWWSRAVGPAAGAVISLGVAAAMTVGLDHPARAAPGSAAPPGSDASPWTWPVDEPAQVVRPFDAPEHRYAAGHRGADLAGTPGAQVRAAGAGRISYAGLLAGRGVVVVVHGDLRTTYEPVTADVAVGEVVVAGQSLGRLAPGHAGCASAACLHWGLRRGEAYLDPVQLVDPGPARLLPLQTAPSGAGVPGTPAQRGDDPPARRGGVLAEPPTAPVAEPHWSLRAAEAPLGAAALVALAAGLALLARPRRPPDGPATVGAALSAPGEADPDEQRAPVARLVDLAGERARRRAAS
jgi:hypothetical protein